MSNLSINARKLRAWFTGHGITAQVYNAWLTRNPKCLQRGTIFPDAFAELLNTTDNAGLSTIRFLLIDDIWHYFVYTAEDNNLSDLQATSVVSDFYINNYHAVNNLGYIVWFRDDQNDISVIHWYSLTGELVDSLVLNQANTNEFRLYDGLFHLVTYNGEENNEILHVFDGLTTQIITLPQDCNIQSFASEEDDTFGTGFCIVYQNQVSNAKVLKTITSDSHVNIHDVDEFTELSYVTYSYGDFIAITEQRGGFHTLFRIYDVEGQVIHSIDLTETSELYNDWDAYVLGDNRLVVVFSSTDDNLVSVFSYRGEDQNLSYYSYTNTLYPYYYTNSRSKHPGDIDRSVSNVFTLAAVGEITWSDFNLYTTNYVKYLFLNTVTNEFEIYDYAEDSEKTVDMQGTVFGGGSVFGIREGDLFNFYLIINGEAQLLQGVSTEGLSNYDYWTNTDYVVYSFDYSGNNKKFIIIDETGITDTLDMDMEIDADYRGQNFLINGEQGIKYYVDVNKQFALIENLFVYNDKYPFGFNNSVQLDLMGLIDEAEGKVQYLNTDRSLSPVYDFATGDDLYTFVLNNYFISIYLDTVYYINVYDLQGNLLNTIETSEVSLNNYNRVRDMLVVEFGDSFYYISGNNYQVYNKQEAGDQFSTINDYVWWND